MKREDRNATVRVLLERIKRDFPKERAVFLGNYLDSEEDRKIRLTNSEIKELLLFVLGEMTDSEIFDEGSVRIYFSSFLGDSYKRSADYVEIRSNRYRYLTEKDDHRFVSLLRGTMVKTRVGQNYLTDDCEIAKNIRYIHNIKMTPRWRQQMVNLINHSFKTE